MTLLEAAETTIPKVIAVEKLFDIPNGSGNDYIEFESLRSDEPVTEETVLEEITLDMPIIITEVKTMNKNKSDLTYGVSEFQDYYENRIFVEQPEAERVATVDNNIHIESLPITIIDATMVTTNKTDLPYGATDFQNTYESCELVIQPETEPISSREQNDPQLHLNLLHRNSQMTPVCRFLDHSDAEEDPFIGDDQLNDPDFIPPIETDSDRDSEEHIIPPKKTKINNQNSAGDNHPQPFAVLSKRCRKIRKERKDKRNSGQSYVTETGKMISEKRFRIVGESVRIGLITI
ncbi:uncharacterized protein LOC126748909 isoform X1 [Anthonomus grandis grandis]|uniref:uncharacterized protein LOC126748909 isoform X1 n=1 Tax=Anthonomus grandis grandis TaxID=2921223 RepID=UPI002165AF5B|nr:uncharacterized protein LOC126748909 isoform X1 [Anthonomus grandis grandis]